MIEEDTYLFDIRGYTILNQVLNEQELATLNATFDEKQAQTFKSRNFLRHSAD